MTPHRDYARPEDYAECVRLHRQFGTSYFFASRFFPPEIRRRVDSLYGFVRVADEWVDNPGSLTLLQSEELLDCFRHELIDGLGGVPPSHPVMRAFLSSATAVGMSADEPLCFLHAMSKDLKQTRYGTYSDLCEYMRGSAAAVGLMMLGKADTVLVEGSETRVLVRRHPDDPRRIQTGGPPAWFREKLA